jgi:hypothetical protein
MGKLVSLAAIPDAFTLIPLWRLHVRYPGVNLDHVVDAVAAAACLAFLLVPRRFAWTLAAVLVAFFALTSFSTGRVVAAQATLARQSTLGSTRDWLQREVPGEVGYLYGGESNSNAVWESIFWNGNVRHVYDFLDSLVPGPLVQPSVGPLPDGRLVLADGSQVREPYMVATSNLRFFGTVVAEAPKADLYAWRIDPPVRVSRTVRNLVPPGGAGVDTEIRLYACSRGTLEIELVAAAPLEADLLVDGRRVLRLRLAAGEDRTLRVHPRPVRAHSVCSYRVRSAGPVRVARADFQALAPR